MNRHLPLPLPPTPPPKQKVHWYEISTIPVKTQTRWEDTSNSAILPGYTINLKSELSYLWERSGTVWLRHYATSREVAGSIPDCVIGIFH
jgi:hypothetical protein